MRESREVDCPVCHGSGEGKLTADEAAEYLRTEAIRRLAPKPKIVVPDFLGEPWLIIFYYQNKLMTREKHVKGDSLEKALQKAARAARAVYERGKECEEQQAKTCKSCIWWGPCPDSSRDIECQNDDIVEYIDDSDFKDYGDTKPCPLYDEEPR